MMLNLHSEPTLPYVCRRIRGWKKCSTVFPNYKNILSYFQRKWKRRSNLILGQAGKQMMLAVPAGIVGQSQQDGLLMIRAPVLTRNVDPLKGSVSRDFRLIFFFMIQTYLHGPLINRVKYFWIWSRLDIWPQSSKNSTPRSAWHRGVKF